MAPRFGIGGYRDLDLVAFFESAIAQAGKGKISFAVNFGSLVSRGRQLQPHAGPEGSQRSW
jgi:hypothetical protein